VGKKKKGKIPDEQGVQEKTSDEQELHNSGGKSESEGKNPVKQVLQYNESSSEYKEDTSNEKELLGCQGKLFYARAFLQYPASTTSPFLS